jgi:DNA-binding CsgD family transcriptional regulator/ArsR family metal-binding transcriptional regulator
MGELQINIKERGPAFLSGFKNISVKRGGVLTIPFPKMGARLEVTADLSPLFPYVNGSVKGARYFDNPERIQFLFEGVQTTLFAQEIIAAAFKDHDHVLKFGENLLCFLNELFEKRHSIQPDYRKSKNLSALDVYKILPRTNCRACGLPSCLAFAGALSTGKATVRQCPGLGKPMEEKAVYPITDRQGRLAGTIELDLPKPEPNDSLPATGPLSLLSGRELQVLKLLAQGATNPEISAQLFISPHTVKSHIVHIYEKLGVNDRAQAAVLAARYKVI